MLIFGWLGVLQFQLGWYANVLFWPALLIALRRWKPSKLACRAISFGLLVCGASAALWQEVPCDGGPCDVVRFGAGFYIWLTAILFAAILFLLQSERDSLAKNAEPI